MQSATTSAARCRTCNGTRQISVKFKGDKKRVLRPCPACSGSGRGYATK